MQHHKKLTLSLIIPCYNEERLLPACFEAIAAQTVPPDEILVIDNNSTDKTAAIARKFPGVKVIHEAKQGLIPARNRGFNQATGDILARIDADARIDPDWVGIVKKHFETDKTDGVTGLGVTTMLPFVNWPRTVFWSWAYFMATEAFFRVPILWGTNMAITKKVWLKIKDQVCTDGEHLHEDQDLSLHIAGVGGHIIRDNHLKISTGGQGYAYWPKLWRYTKMRWNTRLVHWRLGTINVGKVKRMPLWRAILIHVLMFIPTLLMAVTCLLIWPFNTKYNPHSR